MKVETATMGRVELPPPVATSATAPVPKGNRHERRAEAAIRRRAARRLPRESFERTRVFYGGVELEGAESVEWAEAGR